MKRLTGRSNGRAYIIGCPDFAIPKRLAAIEDILGDEYELDVIEKIVRCKDCVYMVGKIEFPGECYCKVLAETVPFNGFCHRGKAALRVRVDGI